MGCKIFTIAGPVILFGVFTSWLLGLGLGVLLDYIDGEEGNGESSGKTDTADGVKVFIDTCHYVFMWRLIQIQKYFTTKEQNPAWMDFIRNNHRDKL